MNTRLLFLSALIGALLALAATSAAGLAYMCILAPEESLREHLMALAIFVLSAPLPFLITGAAVGAADFLLGHRLRGPATAFVVFVISVIAGILVGYRFTVGSPHVSPYHAIILCGASWGMVSAIALIIRLRRVTDAPSAV
jgi:hypothetical protein